MRKLRDVSCNNLFGSLPSWIREINLQLNLVSNNFYLESSNSSVLPHGLNCLQLSFPCNRGSPIYSSFAVQCGGPEYTSYNDVVYESDNEALGPAAYYVTDTNRWGVSLENGNYTVTLLFAEIANFNTGWRRFGRCVFDIYVQRNRVEKDFDITRVAGTCCVPFVSAYGPSVSAISAAPDFQPSVRPPNLTTEKNNTGLIVGIVVGVGLVFLSVLAVYFIA
ncbi:hypothetical protein Pint_18187 [Pistacia integerrima]|uniref:Uncharacterized protein n=1 Tax=Pistacia integerrima TaxID=434235 RepID=A0ACC0YXE5_9ROSI|nr:hypothetical protein Pint_18187 [Pistacia integerrima]